jgi:TPR repeat protein
LLKGCETIQFLTGAVLNSKNIFSLVWAGPLIWTVGLSAAESFAPESNGISPRPMLFSAARADDAVSRYCVSTSPNAGGSTIDPGEPGALNLLGIRYAKGLGVKKNPRMAMRFFLRSAMQGYTPAMANIGTLYEIGATGHPNFNRAYAWMRAALSFGVPEEDHDKALMKLGMIASRLGAENMGGAERLAEAIAARIVENCACCSPAQETELASNASP